MDTNYDFVNMEPRDAVYKMWHCGYDEEEIADYLGYDILFVEDVINRSVAGGVK